MGHMYEKKEVKTTVVIGEFKGNAMFKIVECDDMGKEITERGGYPVKALHNFGLKKATALVKHLEELKQFVEGNS